MTFPVLQQYLARLSERDGSASTSIGLDAEGRALGRFFNCTMTSAFRPLRELAQGRVAAYEGLARSASAADEGLSLWRLLDHAASDDESVELDRLCRMLHAINFFRQAGSADADLYLKVHDRLLSAVSSNHGYAFQRILQALGLPIGRIVLQLPAVTAQQSWLLGYVADNYRRNGFRYAVHAGGVEEARQLLERVRPDAIKLDARQAGDEAALAGLLRRCGEAGTALVLRRVESLPALAALYRVAAETGLPLLAQGSLLGGPQAALRDTGGLLAAA